VSPETSTAEAPKYSETDLQDPAKRAAVVAEYTTDLGTKASWEIDALVKKGVAEGVFKKADPEDPNARPDDMFEGLELQPGALDESGELGGLLARVKANMERAVDGEEYDRLAREMTALPSAAAQVERMGGLIEEAFLSGAVDVTKPVPGRQGRAARVDRNRTIPGVDAIAAVPARLVAHDRLQTVKLKALQAMMNDPMFSEDDRKTFQDRIYDIGQRRDEIKKEEEQRIVRAKAHDQREQANRVEAARKLVKDADAGREQIKELGLHQVTMKAGEKVDTTNIDPSYLTPSIEVDSAGNNVLVPPKVDPKTGELRQDITVTDEKIVDEATKMLEQHNLEMQFGREGAQKELERRAKEAKANVPLDKLTPEQQRIHAARQKEMEGKSEKQMANIRAKAHEEARKMDSQAAAQEDVREYYQSAIDAEPDIIIKRELEAARDEAVMAERERQGEVNKQAAKRRAEAINEDKDAVSTAINSSSDRKSWHSRIDVSSSHLQERALARREKLGFGALPFRAKTKGGVVEAYFRTPGNEHLILFERYDTRTGDLLSQTVITTKEPIRRGIRGGQFPPREVEPLTLEARQGDNGPLDAKRGRGLGRLAGVAGDARRKFFGGPSWMTKNDPIDGENGVYAKYGATKDQLTDFRAQRNGSFLYWIRGIEKWS
jgi:hypothetical protein